MNKKICFNLLGAWHGRPRLRLFTTKPAPSPFGYAQGKLCRRDTKTLRIIEQCKSASAIYLKGVLHAVSFIEGR